MMRETKKRTIPAYVMLCLVAIVMAFAIAGVYSVTKDTIEAAALASQAAARTAVMENAADMLELPVEEGAPVDYCYEAYDASGAVIGYVSQVTAIGFGGEIEITVGMDMSGAITKINVGGSKFSETSGLGAKTRDSAFTDQFMGKSGMLVLKQNIDSVTGASVSSGAVVSGVNKALNHMTALLPQGAASAAAPMELTQAELDTLLPGASNVTWMGGGDGIDGWWQADNGYIVRATGFGQGPIVVTLGFDSNGVVTGIIIGDDNFMETPGYGGRVQEQAYWSQFIGRSGTQTYGDGLDAISGASVTSGATLGAINAAMCFKPDNAVSAAAPAPAGGAPTAEMPAAPSAEMPAASGPDAATAASVAEASPTPMPTPDAATAASIAEAVPTPMPTPDAATAASVTEATPTPMPTPDAATAATLVA